ncbi:hypothetical protein BY996DRAFT_7293450 [Phakopsora pachyrhizi]|nr:hypothetical protein BY996DRAFT_8252228 [Phakopsora pachyrhizi]KAI8444565.1 hypothetical protein BY996DRAFT_8091464 [Phakopsora pachyrhizi]KAI8444566.1 hypothetical protein BY996DRAFT_8091479 [Phakopsora pachyrhizi]KAI8451518.1 hypothetical protein BY996DRAFT_7293450 [Phakopsora pachyrhizi]
MTETRWRWYQQSIQWTTVSLSVLSIELNQGLAGCIRILLLPVGKVLYNVPVGWFWLIVLICALYLPSCFLICWLLWRALTDLKGHSHCL